MELRWTDGNIYKARFISAVTSHIYQVGSLPPSSGGAGRDGVEGARDRDKDGGDGAGRRRGLGSGSGSGPARSRWGRWMPPDLGGQGLFIFKVEEAPDCLIFSHLYFFSIFFPIVVKIHNVNVLF